MVLGPGQGTPGWGTGNSFPFRPAVPEITLNSPLYEWAGDGRLPAGVPTGQSNEQILADQKGHMATSQSTGMQILLNPGEPAPEGYVIGYINPATLSPENLAGWVAYAETARNRYMTGETYGSAISDNERAAIADNKLRGEAFQATIAQWKADHPGEIYWGDMTEDQRIAYLRADGQLPPEP